MDILKFNPFVRFCSEVCLRSEYTKIARAYDFRLFYIISGGFTAYYQDKETEVSEGDIIIIPPGSPYRLDPKKYGKSNHIIVNFDFVSDNYGTPTRMSFEPEPFYEEEIYSKEYTEPFSNIFYMPCAYFCAEMLNEMCMEKKSEICGTSEILSGMMKVLLTRIAREWKKRENEQFDVGGRLCERICAYINSHVTEQLNNVSIARIFGYHPYYINSIFRKKIGVTLHTYILERRISNAKGLLLSTDSSIADIGELCGFSGASYFTECFTKHVGISPKKYRSRTK